ncbi:Phosphatidylinositol 4-kinase pik1alpha (PI4-kinase)(PtdIns-4-kinase) [Entophlyctis sp. JEL0112]|nr:Phosphatidylinositol 4-kinase pik1alpha (PI4-kinase)(PtdIns-4-kinase) [Entophlyctis sp. JEL0112]
MDSHGAVIPVPVPASDAAAASASFPAGPYAQQSPASALLPPQNASSAVFSDTQRAQIGSWLMRLFEGDSFDSRLALHYLHLYPHNQAIQGYVCNAFGSFPVSECEFWLPQLLWVVLFADMLTHSTFLSHILVTRGGSELEAFITTRALESDHVAILTLWYLQTYNNQGGRLSSTNPNASETLERVYAKTRAALFGGARSNMAPIVDDRGQALVTSSAMNESVITIRPANLAAQHRRRNESAVYLEVDSPRHDGGRVDSARSGENDPGRTISPESEAGSSNGFYKVEAAHVTNIDASGEVIGDDDADGSMNSSVSSLASNNPNIQPGIDFSPTLVKGSVVIVGNVTSETLDQHSQIEPGMVASAVDFPLSAPSIEEMGNGTAFNRTLKLGTGFRQNNEDALKEGGSLCNRPSDVDWTIVHKPDFIFMNDPRTRYFQSQLQFIISLSDISDRLRSVPKPARQSALIAELSLLNHNLPANVCIPLWCDGGHGDRDHHWIVRVPPNDAVTLNSADRVPYLLILETVEGIDVSPPTEQLSNLALSPTVQSPLEAELASLSSEPAAGETVRHSTSSMNMADQGANSQENAEYYKTVLTRRHQLSPGNNAGGQTVRSGSATTPITTTSQAVVPPTQKMRTAAVMLAQLYQQEAAGAAAAAAAAAAGVPTGSSTPLGSNSPSPNRKSDASSASSHAAAASKVDFEAIRARLVQEMSVLEDKRYKALEEQRASEKTLGVGNQNSISLSVPTAPVGGDDAVPEGIEENALLKKDKDDPSAAVFKESWDAKCARIRAVSPYGHNPSWKMISVIVKSGSDLRQEVLALQLIKEMQRIWKEENVPVWDGGLVETIQNAISIHSIKKHGYSNNLNAPGLAYTLYDHFIQEFGAPASKKFLKAQDAFMRSLAGYSIVCYLLQIKDRHNGNILIDKDGHTIHIDFGFMLSNSPGNMGFEFAPFKLPQEFVDILGGTRSLKFQQYRTLCKDAFIALRKRWDLIVGLVEIMEKDSVLPCFTGYSVKPSQTPVYSHAQSAPAPQSSGRLFGFLGGNTAEQLTPTLSASSAASAPAAAAAIASASQSTRPTTVGSNPALPVSMKLKERFSLGMTDSQVKDFVDSLVDSSINSIMTRLYDAFQWYSNGVL